MSDAFSPKIVQSLLDTDFYKLTMMQAVLHHYPNAEVEWAFRSRSDENLTIYIDEIRDEISRFSRLKASESELAFLSEIPYIQPDFVRFLSLFRFDLRYLTISARNGELEIRIKGPWLHVILFEVPLLAVISEVRNRNRYPNITLADVEQQALKEFDQLKKHSQEALAGFKVADFGTRRRFSYAAQKTVVELMKSQFPGDFVGTSNVHLAHVLDLKPMGTMAHEWIMAHQQLGPRLVDSQRAALECWVREYRGALGTALTDCITMDAFLADFDLYFTKLFDGLRHDSGDPMEWAEKAIAHYQKLGLDPLNQTLVFSDGLTFQEAWSLYEKLHQRIQVSFGIGTRLTCNIPGVTPCNMVIKMVRCNGQPVAKISDAPGKSMCEDPAFLSYLRHVFNVEN